MPPHLLEMDGRPGRRLPFWRDCFLNSCQAMNYSETTYNNGERRDTSFQCWNMKPQTNTENVPNIQLTWKKRSFAKRLVFLHLGSSWHYFKPHCWHGVSLSLSGSLTTHQKGSEDIYKSIWTIFPIKNQPTTHTHTESGEAGRGYAHFRKLTYFVSASSTSSTMAMFSSDK